MIVVSGCDVSKETMVIPIETKSALDQAPPPETKKCLSIQTESMIALALPNPSSSPLYDPVFLEFHSGPPISEKSCYSKHVITKGGDHTMKRMIAWLALLVLLTIPFLFACESRSLKEENEGLKKQVESLTREKARLDSQTKELTSKSSELTAKIDELTKLNEELKAKVDELSKANEELKAKAEKKAPAKTKAAPKTK